MKVLVVDDEANVRKSLVSFLELRDCDVLDAGELEAGWTLWQAETPDLTLIDVYLAGRDGRELLARIRARDPAALAVMVSGHADLRTAVEAVRAGAFDFLEKPIEPGRLDTLLRNAAERRDLAGRVDGLEKEWLADKLVLGTSEAMRSAFALAAKAAASDLSVLVEGPSGSGKELLARYVRLRSKRTAAVFVVANCAAIPAELFEAELFGSKKGSFTGAAADRPGYFGAAAGGTLFLDEIGELPLALQPKLLRAIEYGEIQPVGASGPVPCDVRLVCATNRDLAVEAAAGRFRPDLYFRIAQIVLRLPSLAERAGDIPGLANFFLAKADGGLGRGFTADALAYLAAKPWPGNVRELRNYVEKCAVLVEAGQIARTDLAAMERGLGAVFPAVAAIEAAAVPAAPTAGPPPAVDRAGLVGLVGEASLKDARNVFDRTYIQETLTRKGSVAAAAASLGLLPNNLSRLIGKLGINKDKSP